MAELRNAFEQSRNGEVMITHLHGKSGMGKSVLLRTFVEQLREEGSAVCLVGRCFERESVPYKALDNLIDALSHYLLQLPREDVCELLPREGFQALARLFPVLKRNMMLLELTHEQTLAEPRLIRLRAVVAFKELLHRLALRRPLVLCIDAFQWGDLDSARLLAEFLSPPSVPPCCWCSVTATMKPRGACV
ncbi:AAA family ATPase [Cystobacter fuscus]